MKKNLFVLLLLIALVFSAGTAVYCSELVIDFTGIEADDIFNNVWNVDPIAESATGEARLYALVSGNFLYVWAEGVLPDPWNNFFFDTDLDTTTGYAGWQWPDMGADFLFADGEFYASTGTGWSWDLLSEPDYVRYDVDGKTAFMAAISLDFFGEIDTLRMAFAGEIVQMPPRNEKTIRIDLF